MRLKIIFTTIILLCSMSLWAQKYKDVFPRIVSSDSENSFEILNAYLQTNLDHPNANFRVALIYIERYKSVDAIREYEKAMALAEQAKVKLFKAKIVITEKEIKKNGEYYFGLVNPGVETSFSELSNFINKEEGLVNDFLQKAPPIFIQFTKSVERYDQAVKTFADIVGSYNSLKELYLLYDDSLKQSLYSLKNNYDSTKIYFNNYLSLRKDYKLNAVSQSYAETPVDIYRLDGLVTQINFLQPKILLWDYSTWVDSVNNVIDITINGLRKSLYENEEKLRGAVLEVDKTSTPESFNIVYADKSLIFNLLKYDYKNAIVPLLKYYEFKQQFIIDQKRQTYFDTATIASDRKLAYYSQMMFAAKLGDSIIVRFESRFNPEQLLRHKEFVNKVFGDTTAMKKYMVTEKEENKKIFVKQADKIKKEILSINKSDSIAGIVKYKRTSIPVYVVKEELSNLPQGQIKTQHLLPSADESLYIAGLQITDRKNLNQEIALAKLSPEKKPVWVKNIDLEIDSAGVDANHWLGDAILTSEGIALVIRSVSLDSSKVVNTLLHLTESGQVKLAKRLDTELYPREINYIEKNNMFILTFFGEDKAMDSQKDADLTVLSINGLGQDIWNFSYTLKGDYIGMINVTNGLLLAGNYSVIKNKAGRTFSRPAGTNAYIISLSDKGALNDVKCWVSDENYHINTFYKVNDNNINLLGSKGEQIIMKGDLQEIFSSIPLK